MNLYLIIGAIVAVVVIVAWWFLYRLYKRIARRCTKKDCGKPTKRVHYIYLRPEDESFPIINADGKMRWFFRQVIKITLAECSSSECKWVKLIRVDWEPISLWHLVWTYFRHRQEYDPPKTEHALVIYGAVRTLYHGKHALDLDPAATETPPVPDLLDEFIENLEELIGGSPDR